jgi:inosine triphosphate pyrophosphatase
MKIPKHQVNNIIVTGKSGAGKQPRIDVIAEELGLKQLSTGSMFRDLMSKDTPLAQEVKSFVNNGLFVPDEVTNKVFLEYFKKQNCTGCILDGYPRTPAQAEFLLKTLNENNSSADMVIEVHREDEQIVNHLIHRRICKGCNKSYHMHDNPPTEDNKCKKCGEDVFHRADDNEEKIKSRLNEFHEKVIPTIEYIKNQNIPHAIVNGYLNPWTPERVRETVIEAVSQAIDFESEKIYFITGNQGKFKEANEILEKLERVEIDLPEIQSMDSKEVIKAKLEEAFKHHSGPFIVEDVSVEFDCLNGLPGPLIKWFLKKLGNDGIYNLINKYENNKATVICHIGYAKDINNIEFFKAEVNGELVKPQGDGFGWGPIFKPEGFDKTYGEMTAEEKNKISMRKLTLNKLKQYLDNKNQLP